MGMGSYDGKANATLVTIRGYNFVNDFRGIRIRLNERITRLPPQ